MSSYVNLLVEDEIHYHSVAQESKLFKTILVLLGVVVMVAGFSAFMSYRSALKKARSLRQRWTQLEPVYEATLATSSSLQATERVAKELEGWANSRLDLPRIMDEVATTVPANVQLTRIYLHSKLPGLDSPPNKRLLEDNKGGVDRTYSLLIKGVVYAEDPADGSSQMVERVPIEFNRAIAQNPYLQPLIGEHKLRRSERSKTPESRNSEDSLPAWEFEMEILFMPRVLR